MATSTRGTKPAAPPPEPEAPKIALHRLQRGSIDVPVVGITPLIPHKWSEKALNMMRAKQQGILRPGREPKNAQEEAASATYFLLDGRPGMPATAFKSAIVEAVRFFPGFTMTEAKRLLYVEATEADTGLVAIEGQLHMREDTPRNATGVVDLRYRNEVLVPWYATLRVKFLQTHIGIESVLALVDAAGNCGVGDWRPGAPRSNTGVFGQWEVDQARAMQMHPDLRDSAFWTERTERKEERK